MITQSFFEEFEVPDNFQLLIPGKTLHFYAGVDANNKPTVFILTSVKPGNLQANGTISVETGRRRDGKWTLSFTLEKSDLLDVFSAFANDLVDSSLDVKSEKEGLAFVESRYEAWREIMASGHSGLLSLNAIKGLTGEMYFLLHYMIPTYGVEKSVLSWIGPREAAQDFVVDDTCYEIKTIASSSEAVTISSLEQLDSNQQGELVVQYADKTSITNQSGCTVNQLYKQLMELVESRVDLKQLLQNELQKMGYLPISYYDNFAFVFKAVSYYQVNASFPALRRRKIPNSIAGAVYQISLSAIEPFKKEG